MADDAPDATTLVHRFLTSKGLQPTGENVRRALEQNASNPGYITGLRNQDPPAAEPGTAAPNNDRGANRRAESGRSNATQTTGGVELPTPPMPPPNGGAAQSAPAPSAQAAPPPAGPQEMRDAGALQRFLATAALGTLGTGGLYAATRLMPSGRSTTGTSSEPVSTNSPAAEAQIRPEPQRISDLAADPAFTDSMLEGRNRAGFEAPQTMRPGVADPRLAAVANPGDTAAQVGRAESARNLIASGGRDDGITAPRPPDNGMNIPPRPRAPALNELARMDVTELMRAGQQFPELADTVGQLLSARASATAELGGMMRGARRLRLP